MRINWQRHARFLLALLVGLLVAILAPLARIDRVLLGSDLFFAVYLLLSIRRILGVSVTDLRRHGVDDDEGRWLILALAVATIVMTLSAVVGALGAHAGTGGGLLRPVLAVASVPLGWATLHMVMSFHYAGLFYTRRSDGKDAGGLSFPGDQPPGLWDFVYFSYTLGMCAQTSDVVVTSTGLRQVVLLHAALSFFFNTVILALAVNVAVALSG